MGSLATNTTVTGSNPPTGGGGNGGGLHGNPPEIFDGNRSRTKEFMRAFTRWWRLNINKPVFEQPYKRVALCLNYIRGKNVEDWTDEQQNTMDQNVRNGTLKTDESHWTTFKAAYNSAYANMGEKIQAENKLSTIKMERGDLDSYIATFNKLLALAGYTDTEYGALKLFKRGLPGPLNVSIVQNTTPIPQNLKDWQQAARDQQLRYLQTWEFTSNRKPLSDAQKLFAKRLGVPNKLRRDPDAMDIDTAQVNNRLPFTKLTEAEKTALRARGACFRCRQDGHMSRNCPRGNRTADVGRPAPTIHKKESDEVTTNNPLQDLVNQMKTYLTTDETKQQFFDAIVDEGFV
jgi:hypothetical protein